MTDGDRPLERQLGEQCDVCGRYYRLLYKVPNDVWSFISPTGKKEGYLCPGCADFRARKAGIELLFEAYVREHRNVGERRKSREKYQRKRMEEQG